MYPQGRTFVRFIVLDELKMLHCSLVFHWSIFRSCLSLLLYYKVSYKVRRHSHRHNLKLNMINTMNFAPRDWLTNQTPPMRKSRNQTRNQTLRQTIRQSLPTAPFSRGLSQTAALW
jgi:hypothetical protein